MVIHTSTQFMHTKICGLNGEILYLVTMVYAYNQLELRKQLWQDITQLQIGSTDP